MELLHKERYFSAASRARLPHRAHRPLLILPLRSVPPSSLRARLPHRAHRPLLILPCAWSTSLLLGTDALTERSLAAGGHACVAAAPRDAGSRPPRAERPRRRARPPAGRRPARLGRASRQSWLGGRRPLRSAPLLGALAPVLVLDAMVSTPVAALRRGVHLGQCSQVRGLANRAWEERRDSARLHHDSRCLLQKSSSW